MAMQLVIVALTGAALAGTLVGWAQLVTLWLHLRGPRRAAAHDSGPRPPISVLKPLCGLDDHLATNLESFADLGYPDYEVLLGVRSADDPATALARAAVARWPHRFRLVLQDGAPGLNPKVNQLITLARHARHELLLISDSNTRAAPGYLDEIAACFEDPRVGLVTHPLVGEGTRGVPTRPGAVADNLHLTGTITPSLVAAKVLCGKDYVVGKSMAMRRADIAALGGFVSVKDVLAEDYVLGRAVTRRLGKRIALARTPVVCVSVRRSLTGFVDRYARWSVMQRQCAGLVPYFGLLLLNPILLALGAALLAPGTTTAAVLGGCTVSRMGANALASRLLRGRAYAPWVWLATPIKDLLVGIAWARGLFRRSIDWRSTRLTVRRGSTLTSPATASPGPFEGATGLVTRPG